VNTILNMKTLMQRVGDDKEIANEILEMFIDTIPELIDNLKAAISQGNSDLLIKTSHEIKGISGNISAEKLAETAAQLESYGKKNDFDNCKEILPIFDKEFEELRVEIKQLLEGI